MYSYYDENFIMNSLNDQEKILNYSVQLNNNNFSNIIELSDLNSYLAALDDFVVQNPQQTSLVMNYLNEIVKNPQIHLSSDVASQHIESAPRILFQKKLQYANMLAGKEYEANIASLNAQQIYLEACYDVALEMNLSDVVENIEHDMSLIDLRKKIEVAKHGASINPQWKQELEKLQIEYDESITTKTR